MMRKKDHLQSEKGVAMVITALAIAAVLACIALAVDISLLSASSLQQYNNAQYGADAALAGFSPANCTPYSPAAGPLACFDKKCTSLDIEKCWRDEMAYGQMAAEQVTGDNFYISLPKVSQGMEDGGGTIEYGHCAKRESIATPPPDCTAAYCCFQINPTVTIIDSTGAPAQYPILFVNAAHVKLRSDDSVKKRAMRTLFGIFGSGSVVLKKGEGTSHFDPERTKVARNELYPFQLIDANWGAKFRPTPTPPPVP